MGKLVKETESSFDAYDAQQFPKNRIDPQVGEPKQFILLDNTQSHGSIPSRQNIESRNSGVDSVPDAYFQTFLDPSNNNSRQTSQKSSVAAAYKSFGYTSTKKSIVNSNERKRMVAMHVFEDNDEFIR